MARRSPIQLYPIFPAHSPPLPELATLANRESAGKYYAETRYYRGSAGNETQSQGIEPGTPLLLDNYIINIEVHFKSHINARAGILKVISKVVSH